MIDSLLKMSAAGGTDRYPAGTYRVTDETLKSPLVGFIVSADAVITSCKEIRWSDTLRKFSYVAHTPNYLADSLLKGDMYLFEYPIAEIVVASGVIIGYHVPTGRNTDFTTTPTPTTTLAPTTTAAPTTTPAG